MQLKVSMGATICSAMLLTITPTIANAEPFTIKVDGLNKVTLSKGRRMEDMDVMATTFRRISRGITFPQEQRAS